MSPSSEVPLLSVRDLAVSYATAEGGKLQALDGVSFDVPSGRTVAIVGESGCGKTATALAIMRLLPSPGSAIDRGRILFQGEDLLGLSERDMQRIRGGKIGMVFQEPLTALHPVYTIGDQIIEAIRLHDRRSRSAAKAHAIELLHRVGFSRPEERIDSYPHELSGGMRQRVLIAMALAAGPRLLIADEPTSALDTALRAQIMGLLSDLSRELGMSLLVITHDLPFVVDIADELVVLYAGIVVETGKPSRVLREPRHPYTRALLQSVPPTSSFRVRGERRVPLPTMDGAVPDLRSRQTGCPFASRCPDVLDRCRSQVPSLTAFSDGSVRCFLHESPNARGTAA